MQRYHENPEALHIGTMPNRSYYIPYEAAAKALEDGYNSSARFLLLNGTWDFSYFERFEDVPDEIADYDDAIPVPSVWQQDGYDHHQYTNTRYPFPYDPPYVPADNPCGAYHRAFEIKKRPGIVYCLNFEGVDSCMYVWVNDKFIGYSQVSHSTSEFDITSALQDGANDIRVLVAKWCDGSYLEDQDKLRMSGIFRDVYILERSTARVSDFFVKQSFGESFASAQLSVELTMIGEPDVEVSLFAPDGAQIKGKLTDGVATFKVRNPILWSAECPALYKLLIRSGDEFIGQRVGLRKIEVKRGVVLLNGKPIKFRGVNRHDSDPVTGYAISREQLLRDLTLMKQHNVNAIRTSHYPNAPYMVQMCDQYGFYVIDESDVEAHGVMDLYDGADKPRTFQNMKDKYARIACMPMFADAILDRVQMNVMRDKNASSVVIWSMGNESGYGENIEAAGRWTKAFDPSRLTHYEGMTHLPSFRKNDTSMFDLHSRMYASVAEVEDYFERGKDKRPFVQCEYIHAMGNGPGDVMDYQKLIDKYPGFCGGFVWEFCDHSVYMGKTACGRDKYFYGGDWGDYPHDGNFCMDGLVYPDRTPHTGFKEVKQAYRPLSAQWAGEPGGVVCVTNFLDFADAKDYAYGEWELTCDGKRVDGGRIDPPSIAPHESAEITLAYTAPAKGKCLLNITWFLLRDASLLGAGHELCRDQLLVRDGHVKPELSATRVDAKAAIQLSDEGTRVVVTGAAFRYTFDKRLGAFDSLCFDQRERLTRPMEYNIWRAPTDNDRNIKLEWIKAGYDRAQTRVYEVKATASGGNVVISAQLSLAAVYRQKIMEIIAKYTVRSDGAIEMELNARRDTELPFLPRFGVRMFLPREATGVEYFGYGPMESYQDKRAAAYLGKFSTTPRRNHEDYIRPQENGAHFGCDYVTVMGARGAAGAAGATGAVGGVCAMSETPFGFSVSPYTQEELACKAHNFELEECGDTVLCLDCAQSGIGSNSCGPELLPAYRLSQEAFEFRLTIVPVV